MMLMRVLSPHTIIRQRQTRVIERHDVHDIRMPRDDARANMVYVI